MINIQIKQELLVMDKQKNIKASDKRKGYQNNYINYSIRKRIKWLDYCIKRKDKEYVNNG